MYLRLTERPTFILPDLLSESFHYGPCSAERKPDGAGETKRTDGVAPERGRSYPVREGPFGSHRGVTKPYFRSDKGVEMSRTRGRRQVRSEVTWTTYKIQVMVPNGKELSVEIERVKAHENTKSQGLSRTGSRWW